MMTDDWDPPDGWDEEPETPPWPPSEDLAPPPSPMDERKSELDRLRSHLMHGADVENIPAPEPLIADWLDLESLAVLYGRPNGGKSFIAIDMALCIATGSWWHGHEIATGSVLYVAAEGRRGLGIRQRAWKRLNNQQGHPLEHMHWLPHAVNLLDPVKSTALIGLATEIQPRLIVIDTLARSMSGGDENSGKDMGRLIETADHLRSRTGACVLLVHHSGKDASAGARGHSSLLGALDTELELKSADNILILSTTKQKENAEQPPLRLTLMPAEESMAVAKYRGQDVLGDELSSKHQQTLEALASIDMGEGASATDWAAVAEEQGIKRATFFRHRKLLVEKGLVTQLGTPARPKFTIIPAGVS